MNTTCPLCLGKPREEVKYVAMCDQHQQETRAHDARRMGVPDLLYAAGDVLNDPASMISEIQSRLKRFPEQYLIIKVVV